VKVRLKFEPVIVKSCIR